MKNEAKEKIRSLQSSIYLGVGKKKKENFTGGQP